jgi:hypothetical protein
VKMVGHSDLWHTYLAGQMSASTNTKDRKMCEVIDNIKRVERMEELEQALFDLTDKHGIRDMLLALGYVCDDNARAIMLCKGEGDWQQLYALLVAMSRGERACAADVLLEEDKG